MRLKFKISILLIVIGIVYITCKSRYPAEKFYFDKLYSFAIQEDVKKSLNLLNLFRRIV
jgi:hypothetical protein